MAEDSSRTVKIWASVVLALALFVVGAVWAVKSDDTIEPQDITLPAGSEGHFKGNAEAKVVLLEYGDFQCSACASIEPMVQQIVQEFGSQIKFVYRHFPLRNIHPNANIAAQASEAAAPQGKFWEMHDMLYARQDDWDGASSTETIFLDYAAELGLDIDRFRQDLKSAEVRQTVEEDYQSAVQNGLSSTPTFILNNQVIRPQSYNDFRELINNALNPATPDANQ